MGCSEYGPLLSRFLDEDLVATEVERLLQHLSLCTACQRELDILEKLRYYFQTAGEIESVPWPEAGFLEKAMARLEQEEDLQEEADVKSIPSRLPSRRDPSSWWETIMAWVSSGMLFPHRARQFTYAVPVLAILVLGLCLMPGKQTETIDVSSIQPSRDLNFSLGEPDPSFDSYVFHHATQQPLGDLGDELPLIQTVADTGR